MNGDLLQEKDKALVQKEIRQNAEVLIKNKVDFIILEVFYNNNDDSIGHYYKSFI